MEQKLGQDIIKFYQQYEGIGGYYESIEIEKQTFDLPAQYKLSKISNTVFK